MVGSIRQHNIEPSPIGEAVGEFLGFLAERGASLNTIAAYRNDLDQLANSMEVSRADSGDAALDRATIEEFVVGLRGRGYRDASIARKLAAARSFFVFLGAEGSVSANPADGFALPRVPKALPRLISAKEVRKLLDQPARHSTREAKRDRAMLELLSATGLRVSELVALDTASINLDGDNSYVRCLGRRGDERTISIPPRTREALVEYLESARPLLARDGDEQALFLNRRGGRITRQGLWLILKGYIRAAHLSDDITPHTLRHSFAANMLRGGMPLSDVQQLLGHSALSSTRVYSAFSNKAGG